MTDDQNNNQQRRRTIPINDLDFAAQMTAPKWGSDDVNQELKNRLTKDTFVFDDKGNLVYEHRVCKGKIGIEITRTSKGEELEELHCEKCNKNVNVNDVQPKFTRKAIWSQLGYMTQDLRLSNLSQGNVWKGEIDEVAYCEKWLNLAGDLLSEGYDDAFQSALQRVASKTEICQSKKGFLRNRMGTSTFESKSETIEPSKKSMSLGGKNQ